MDLDEDQRSTGASIGGYTKKATWLVLGNFSSCEKKVLVLRVKQGYDVRVMRGWGFCEGLHRFCKGFMTGYARDFKGQVGGER